MAITNNIKKQYDLPIWEMMRFAPLASASLNELTTIND
jgi:hypothetical protein